MKTTNTTTNNTATATATATVTTEKRPVGRPRIHPVVPKRFKMPKVQKQLFDAISDSPSTEREIKDIALINLGLPKAQANQVFKGLVYRNYLRRNSKGRYTKSDGLKPL